MRDVEDLNGNPMVSPVSWVAFVDRNALKWSQRTLRVTADYDAPENFYTLIDIINHSGRRHQFSIESLPDWLTVSESYGSLNAQEEKQIRLNFDANLPVGVYNDQIYLTDEDGLAEPLIIEYTVQANPPYNEIDHNKYPLNMSVCGQVMIAKANETVYDTDENDIVYAMYNDECVGMANITFDELSNKSKLHLTVYGSDAMTRKPIRFRLWQASTGKVFDLSANRNVVFAHGFVYGCGDGQPVVLTTSGSERQTINLQAGWNWNSFNLIPASNGDLAQCLSANEAWKEGDIIKNPNTRQFSTFNLSSNTFAGTLSTFQYTQMYMIFSQSANTMHLSGNNLPADSMTIKVRGDGQWSPMPCMLKQVTSVTEALSDYYDNAAAGDLIKSHDHFAYFSEDKKWEGDLTALRPGEGYLFRRTAPGTVNIRFFNRVQNNAPRREQAILTQPSAFTNPSAATNMTMIARIEGLQVTGDGLQVFVGNELTAVATPIVIDDETYYFLTIQSDKMDELRFEIDGQTLTPEGGVITYSADAHHGSLKAPVVLKPTDDRPYKIIEDQHVVIIRNNEKYDVTGKKLQ